MANIVLPHVRTFLLADSVFQQKSGKWCVIGVFQGIGAKKFPILHQSLGMFLELTEVPKGEHQVCMVFVNSMGRELARSPLIKLTCSQPIMHDTIGLGMTANNLPIPEPGVYCVQVMFNGQLLSHDSRIVVRQLPGGKP